MRGYIDDRLDWLPIIATTAFLFIAAVAVVAALFGR